MPRRSLALAIPALLLLALAFALWRTVASDGPSVVAPTTPPPAPPPHESEHAAVTSAAEAAIVPERALATPTSDLPSIAVAPGRALLLGFVADRAGVVVDQATLWFGEPGGRADRTPAARSTIEGGEYALPSLPAAIVPFRIESEGFATLELALDLRAGGVLRHDFLLDRAALLPVHLVTPDGAPIAIDSLQFQSAGEETPSGSPDEVERQSIARQLSAFARGLAVVATASPLPPRLAPTPWSVPEKIGLGQFHRATDAPFRNAAIAVPPGAFGVLETPLVPCEATLLFMHEVVATQRAIDPAAPLRFAIDPAQLARFFGEVRGRVVDGSSGKPIVAAQVQVNDVQTHGPALQSDAEGRFERTLLRPGWKNVQIDFAERARWERAVLVDAGRVTDLGELALEPGLTLRGTLVDGEGRPVKAILHAWRLDRHLLGAPFGSHVYWSVEEPGRFEIPSLGSGRYVIGAQEPDDASLQARAVVDLSSGSPSPLALVLTPATAVDLVTGLGPDRVVVSTLARSDGIVEMAAIVRTRFALRQRLLPGSWTWTLHEEGRELRRVAFEVGSTPLRITLHGDGVAPTIDSVDAEELEAPREERSSASEMPTLLPTAFPGLVRGILLVGRVQDGAGAPIAGANITATPLEGPARYGRSASDGQFAIAGLAAGRFDLRARAEGCVTGIERIELGADRAPPAVAITLQRTLPIEVFLEDETGAPLERAFEQRFRHAQLAQEVRVVATLDAPGETVARTTQGAGEWRPNWSGGPGTLELREPPPLFVSVLHAGRVLASAELAEGETSIHLRVPIAELDAARATLRFRLVDAETGAVVRRAFAGLTGLNGSMHSDPRDLPEASGGVITLADEQAGRRNLCIALDGGVFFSLVVELPPGQTLDLGDLRVRSSTKLRGTVVNEEGAPLATSLRIVHYDPAGRPQLDGGRSNAESDAAGRFEISTAQTRVRLQGSERDFALDPLIVDVGAAAAAGGEVAVVLRRGVAVALRPGRADEACEVALLRNGELLRRTQLQAGDALRVRLVGGDYQALVEYEGAPPIEQPFTVGATALEVALP